MKNEVVMTAKEEAQVFAAAQTLLDAVKMLDKGTHLMLQVSNDKPIEGMLSIEDEDIENVLSVLND